MSGPERFDDVTHELVTGLDEIHVPPAVLRATPARRGIPLFAIPATALVVVVALALGAALRPADNGVAAPAGVASPTPPTKSASPTQTSTPTDIRAARTLTEAQATALVEKPALAVIDALKAKDGAKLATLAHPELVGGAGVYTAASGHGPFIHIDTRGYRARWSGTSGG